MTHIVQVIEKSTGKVVKEFTAKSERQADKIEDGLLINLNWVEFKTNVKEQPR